MLDVGIMMVKGSVWELAVLHCQLCVVVLQTAVLVFSMYTLKLDVTVRLSTNPQETRPWSGPTECIVNCQIVWSVSCDDCHVSAYQSLCDNHYYYSPRDTIVLPPVRWNRYFDLDIKFPWLIFLNSFLCVLLAAWHCLGLAGVGGGCE